MLYSHNDSGGPPDIYALDETGHLLMTLHLSGATNVDWEDIAVGPDTRGRPCIYAGDIGDGQHIRAGQPHQIPNGDIVVREPICLYRTVEPANITGSTVDVTDWTKTRLRYPDGFHSCEAMFVDPVSADLFLVVKDSLNADEHTSRVYTATAAQLQRAADTGRRETARYAGSVRTSVNSQQLPLATGADISHDGSWIVVKNYEEAFLWPRRKGQSISAVFREFPDAPYYLPLTPAELQPAGRGEAVTFRADSSGFFTAQEGVNTPLWFFALDGGELTPPLNAAAAKADPGLAADISWDPPEHSATIVEYRLYDGSRCVGWVYATTDTIQLVGHTAAPHSTTVLVPGS